jgi:hypothetical protein
VAPAPEPTNTKLAPYAPQPLFAANKPKIAATEHMAPYDNLKQKYAPVSFVFPLPAAICERQMLEIVGLLGVWPSVLSKWCSVNGFRGGKID